MNLLETPDEGVVTVAGETITMRHRRDGRAEPADRRQVDRIRSELGMVFQNFNLWLHLTVLGNLIEAPVHVQKRPRAECIEKARALLAKVGMSERELLSRASLRGPAAARGDRARPRDAAKGDAVRRADLGARSRTGRRGAPRYARARRGRSYDAGRDPRDELCPRRVDPGDVPAPRAGRGGGTAAGAFFRLDLRALPPVHLQGAQVSSRPCVRKIFQREARRVAGARTR